MLNFVLSIIKAQFLKVWLIKKDKLRVSEENNNIIMPCTYEEALQIEDDFLQFAKEVQERNSKNEIKTSIPIKRVRRYVEF